MGRNGWLRLGNKEDIWFGNRRKRITFSYRSTLFILRILSNGEIEVEYLEESCRLRGGGGVEGPILTHAHLIQFSTVGTLNRHVKKVHKLPAGQEALDTHESEDTNPILYQTLCK
jgi:hypothetical protein